MVGHCQGEDGLRVTSVNIAHRQPKGVHPLLLQLAVSIDLQPLPRSLAVKQGPVPVILRQVELVHVTGTNSPGQGHRIGRFICDLEHVRFVRDPC